MHDADTDTDTDILARILADTSDTRDFLQLFQWQAEGHAYINLATTILASISTMMSVSVPVSASWNARVATELDQCIKIHVGYLGAHASYIPTL